MCRVVSFVLAGAKHDPTDALWFTPYAARLPNGRIIDAILSRGVMACANDPCGSLLDACDSSASSEAPTAAATAATTTTAVIAASSVSSPVSVAIERIGSCQHVLYDESKLFTHVNVRPTHPDCRPNRLPMFATKTIRHGDEIYVAYGKPWWNAFPTATRWKEVMQQVKSSSK
jgi:hypothetical protein